MPQLEVRRSTRPPTDRCILTVAGVAVTSLVLLWIWSASSAALPPSHGVRPADSGTLTWFFAFLVSWVLMTAAMMLPSALPLLWTLQRVARNCAGGYRVPLVAAAAYLGIWASVGIAVWACFLAAEIVLPVPADSAIADRLAGVGLAAAGLFGLSPLARTCLRACRRPFGFMARYWRGGSDVLWQAGRIGAAYGISCVGCCVPMIGMMFLAGLMNLASMLALAILMVAMKVSGIGPHLASCLAVALVIAGVAIGMQWAPIGLEHHH
jgi:predicted metal-binding membrane protein